MADLLVDVQSAPATPASGQVVGWPDTSSKSWWYKNADGNLKGDLYRAATAAQGAGFASDTYVTSSGLLLPSTSMVAGMWWRWQLTITKTAAGTATPIWQVRIGTGQSTSDTSRLSITTAAQTAASDTALVTILLTCRSVGASGVLRGAVWIQHNLAATGFANTPAGFNLVSGTSSGFDNTALGGSYVGLSVNGGTSASWTIEQVLAQCGVG